MTTATDPAGPAEPARHTAQCLCGSVRFSIAGPLRDVAVCHCGQCRQWHGAPGPYTAALWSAVTFDREAGLAWYQSSEIARRGFCRVCGSSLFWEQIGAAEVSIAAGVIDPPTGLSTIQHIFTGEKSDFYALATDAPVRAAAKDVQQQRRSAG